jgi:hypothetical protein
MLHSLLLQNHKIEEDVLKQMLNQLLDPDSTLYLFNGCVCEVIEIKKDNQIAYIITFNAITPRLASLYQHLYQDDARIVFNKDLCYQVQLADKYKQRYLKPTLWKTLPCYNIEYKIIYKSGPVVWNCEIVENLI